ncbi:MAG: hypothetical protein ACOCG5_06660, partial [Candidatus Alkaliphilus sp. MAG34]
LHSEFAYVTHATINEGIILKYRSFAGQTNPARLRTTKMWDLHSNDKKRKKCFFTQSDSSFYVEGNIQESPFCVLLYI